MKALSALLGLVCICILAVGLQADTKEGTKVNLQGKLVCGKCTLKECEKCTNVLQVKKGDKTINFFLKDKGNKEAYHKMCCAPNSSIEATVAGTCVEVDGKKWVTPTKVTVKKADD
jgi:hypothetical protein